MQVCVVGPDQNFNVSPQTQQVIDSFPFSVSFFKTPSLFPHFPAVFSLTAPHSKHTHTNTHSHTHLEFLIVIYTVTIGMRLIFQHVLSSCASLLLSIIINFLTLTQQRKSDWIKLVQRWRTPPTSAHVSQTNSIIGLFDPNGYVIRDPNDFGKKVPIWFHSLEVSQWQKWPKI